MKILDDKQIRQKITRLAHEIIEQNFEEEEIILAGINRNGMTFAKLLFDALQAISSKRFVLAALKLNPANPLEYEVQFALPPEECRGKVVIVVDDVANTGRTIFYACKPLLNTLPKKVAAAVLVDRTHKSFPVKVDYVGLSLATTLLEDIDVQIRDVDAFSVYLR